MTNGRDEEDDQAYESCTQKTVITWDMYFSTFNLLNFASVLF